MRGVGNEQAKIVRIGLRSDNPSARVAMREVERGQPDVRAAIDYCVYALGRQLRVGDIVGLLGKDFIKDG